MNKEDEQMLFKDVCGLLAMGLLPACLRMIFG